MSEDELRDAVQRAVDVVSLRGIARELGMQANGLRHFLEGGKPQEHTRLKLEAWYRSISETTARKAAGVLLVSVRHERRDEAGQELLLFLAGLFRRFGASVPDWLERLEDQDR